MNTIYNILVKNTRLLEIAIILLCNPLNPFPIYEYPCVKFHRGILFAIIYNNTASQF